MFSFCALRPSALYLLENLYSALFNAIKRILSPLSAATKYIVRNFKRPFLMVLHIRLAKRQNRVQNSKINFPRYILMKDCEQQTHDAQFDWFYVHSVNNIILFYKYILCMDLYWSRFSYKFKMYGFIYLYLLKCPWIKWLSSEMYMILGK